MGHPHRARARLLSALALIFLGGAGLGWPGVAGAQVLAPRPDGDAQPIVGWKEMQLPGRNTGFIRYLPATVDPAVGAPAVLFLHDLGTNPDRYRSTLASAANQLGVVVIAPTASSSRGWGFSGDYEIIQDSLYQTSLEIALDPDQIGVAGHGSGGAYAYLLAYLTELRFCGVFALGPSYLPVTAVFDDSYLPPLRMAYGAEDPALERDAPRLRQQWDLLELDWEEEVRPGFGHSSFADSTMLDGFRFLIDRVRPVASDSCVNSETGLCLGGGRFLAQVSFKSSEDLAGRGHVVQARTRDSGLFWFFDTTNWELLVKVLDACSVNGHFWVFSSASTSLDFRLTVTDMSTGAAVQYRNVAGDRAPAIADTDAFTGCPEP